MGFRPLIALAFVVLVPAVARAQAPQTPRTGVLQGSITTQGTVRLPGGFAALALTGHSERANRYWTMVLAADLGAFAPLSFFQTRPPWALEPPPKLRASGIHRLASYVVKRGTTGVNTFPSGHVAVTIAVAAGVMSSLPVTGAILLGVAASIGVACVVGRYHYAMDVIAGAVLGTVVCVVVAMFGV